MKRRMICLLLLLLSLPFPVAYAATEGAQSNVQGHWAEQQLTDWIGKGLIKGYGDGSLRPNGPITRAEFMALVNRSFDLTDKSEVAFNDADSKRWDYEQVAIALHAGYISGFSDGTIRTSNKVTRQEAAVMLAKLLKLDTSAGADLSQYTDAARIPAWSKPMIAAVVAEGIMAGYDNGSLGFDKVLTRAETIVMLNRALSVKVAVAYDQAGAYGPETGNETIVGDVLLNASGVSLRNTTIKGNLTFGERIGEGEAMILNVQVDGDTFIRGGGMHSIYIVGSTLGEVEVNKPSGDVRVAIDDQSKIDHIITYSNTTIESTTAAQAKAAVAPHIAKEPEVKVLAAAPQKPNMPTTPPVGSKPEVWTEYFRQVTKYQEDLLAYALYISSLPNVTSAGSDTTTSVYGNVSDVSVTGNNSQMDVSGLVDTLMNIGSNSIMNVGGGVGSLTDSGSNSQTTIRDFVNDASISGNNSQLLVGGNTGNLTVSGDNSSIEVAGQTGDATIAGSDTRLRLVGANNISLVGNNNTITSRGEIGNLIVGETSSGNQLGLGDNASDIAKFIPLEKANIYSSVSTSNPPDRTAFLIPTPTTPATDTTLPIVSAKAVGAKKIEVKFNKSIDPASIRLSVSKNGSPIAVQDFPDNETKVYTLTLAEKLTEGTYSVTASYTDSSTVIGSAEVRVEDEKIAKISFVNPSDTVAIGTRIGIEVEAKNQYGESLPNLSGFEVTSTVPVEISAGRSIVVVDTSSQSLQTGITIIPITVTDRVSQVTVTQNFRLGSVPIVSRVELRGSFRGIDGQEVSQVEWAHIYHMNLDLYDQYGHMLLYPLSSGAGTVQTSLNPYLSNSVGALGEAPAGEPGTLSLPITVEPSGSQEGKDYTFTIYVGGASASKTFHVIGDAGDAKLAALSTINAAAATDTWTDVTADTFTTAGVTDVNSSNFSAVNAALNVNGSTPRTVAEIQAVVNLVLINGASQSDNWSGITVETFVSAGMNDVTAENIDSIMIVLAYGYMWDLDSTDLQKAIDGIIVNIGIALSEINQAADADNWDLIYEDQLGMFSRGIDGSNVTHTIAALQLHGQRVWTPAALYVEINRILEELEQ